jgi:hypothetical protein
MTNVKYTLLFVLIQLVSALLFLAGLPVCAVLAYRGIAKQDANGAYHWPWAFWLWDNAEDGTCPTWYRKAHPTRSDATNEFIWTALRNSVNNLRYVRGVSAKGRPLWLYNWTIRGKVFYFKAGWLSNGYPVLSAGAGKW